MSLKLVADIPNAYSRDEKEYVILYENMNVREGPGLKYPIIGEYPGGSIYFDLGFYDEYDGDLDSINDKAPVGTVTRSWILLGDGNNEPFGWVCRYRSLKTFQSQILNVYYVGTGAEDHFDDKVAYAAEQEAYQRKVGEAWTKWVNEHKANGGKVDPSAETETEKAESNTGMTVGLLIATFGIAYFVIKALRKG